MVKKELLYCWVLNGFCVLVPKKRGEGFLKQPYGHHHDQVLSNIEGACACDIYGLDGHLHFDGPATRSAYVNWGERPAFESLVLTRLTAHFGIEVRAIGQDEFWRLQPSVQAA